MIKVVLYPPLADAYGVEHDLHVRSAREAIAALSANYPGFRRDFLDGKEYFIIADGDGREGADGAAMPVSREVHFVPRVEGRVELGALLITAIIPGISATAATIIGGLLITGLMLGASLLFSSKQKKELDPSESPPEEESYAFAGPVNTTEQGVAVPVVFGRCFTGSVVISAALELGTEIEI